MIERRYAKVCKQNLASRSVYKSIDYLYYPLSCSGTFDAVQAQVKKLQYHIRVIEV